MWQGGKQLPQILYDGLDVPWCSSQSRQRVMLAIRRMQALGKHLAQTDFNTHTSFTVQITAFGFQHQHQGFSEFSMFKTVLHRDTSTGMKKYTQQIQLLGENTEERQEVQETFWLCTKHLFTQLLFLLSVVLCLGLQSDKELMGTDFFFSQ